MAKSLRSKWKRKMRAVKRVRYGEKEKAKLVKMVEEAKTTEAVTMRTADEVAEERMDTTVKSEHNGTTFRNKHGNYPKWMSRKKVTKLKQVAKKKAKNKKKM